MRVYPAWNRPQPPHPGSPHTPSLVAGLGQEASDRRAAEVAADLDATRVRTDAAVKKLQLELAAAHAAHETAAARLQVRLYLGPI